MSKDRKTDATLLDWLKISDRPNWKRAKPLGALLGALISIGVPLLILSAFAGAFVVVYGTIKDVFDPASNGPNLGAGALIAALLGAPFLIWGTIIKQRTWETQKEGHITDRISKAVEQLGAEKTVKKLTQDGQTVETTEPNIEVRIGGLLSLERIAQDSIAYDKGRDHVRVMEILCAYVRENSMARDPQVSLRERYENSTIPTGPNDPPLTDQQFMERHGIPLSDDLEDHIGIESLRHWALTLPKLRTDVQQALDIIGRRDADQRRIEARWGKDASPDAEWVFDHEPPPIPIRYHVSPPEGAEMASHNKKLDAWKTLIEGYRGYRLDLTGANLQAADLKGANLSGAKLGDAKLDGADLRDARMEGADLSFAQMVYAGLQNARLSGADLTRARLEGARLLRSRMECAGLHQARMEGADLMITRMDGADFEGAKLDGQSDLDTVFALGAQVRNANWTDANWSQEQIHSMFGDASVTLPNDIIRPPHWPDWELRPFDFSENGFHTQWKKWRADPESYPPPPKPEE